MRVDVSKIEKTLRKLKKKDPVVFRALQRKINEIAENPSHYKPLKHDLAGERRVHIMKSFVLKFEIDDVGRVVTFLVFGHHDDAYKR